MRNLFVAICWIAVTVLPLAGCAGDSSPSDDATSPSYETDHSNTTNN